MSLPRIPPMKRHGTSGYCFLNGSGRFFTASPRFSRLLVTASCVVSARTHRKSYRWYAGGCARWPWRCPHREGGYPTVQAYAASAVTRSRKSGLGRRAPPGRRERRGGARGISRVPMKVRSPTGRENSTKISVPLASVCSPRATVPLMPIRLTENRVEIPPLSRCRVEKTFSRDVWIPIFCRRGATGLLQVEAPAGRDLPDTGSPQNGCYPLLFE